MHLPSMNVNYLGFTVFLNELPEIIGMSMKYVFRLLPVNEFAQSLKAIMRRIMVIIDSLRWTMRNENIGIRYGCHYGGAIFLRTH